MPKISELPLANKLKEEDYIPIVQDGVTKKVKGTHFVTEEEYSLDAFSPTIAANDKAMYKFGEGDTVDFSDSAYDGAYKSAILKGETIKISELSIQKHGSSSGGTLWLHSNVIDIFKPNTLYTFFYEIEISNLKSVGGEITVTNDNRSVFPNNLKLGTQQEGTQVICFEQLSKTSFEDADRYGLRFADFNGTVLVKKALYCEGSYSTTLTNWESGLKSVRMPVLTTTGKNLFDGEVEGGSFDNWGNKTDSYNSKRSINLIEVKPNTKYKIVKPFADWHSIIGFKENDFSKPINDSIGSHAVIDSNTSQIQEFTTSPTTKFLALVCVDSIDISQTMIVAGSETNYTFEPHKSNILTTPEDLELRGIGDVKDTLDLTTGELTQHIEEVVLDGSRDENVALAYVDDTTLVRFNINNVMGVPYGNANKILCSSLPYLYIHDLSGGSATVSQECISNHSQVENMISIIIKKSRLSSVDEEGFRAYLQSNPITIQYVLATPIVKTVDLSGTPFGYKGGHIIKSSAEGSLLPKFEYEVAVSRGAQISQNTSTLIKHDEKITELLRKTAATYINQKAEIAHLLNMSNTLEEAQTIPFIEDDYVNDDCMVDSDMVMDDMQVEPEKEIIDNVDTLLIDLIYDLIELNDTLDLSEKVELFRQSGLIDKHNYEIIKEKLNPTFKEEDYADINQ